MKLFEVAITYRGCLLVKPTAIMANSKANAIVETVRDNAEELKDKFISDVEVLCRPF